MILRVRLEAITIHFEGEQFTIPSMPEKIVHLPDEPVAPDRAFRGKHLVMNYPREPFIIKWGFQRAVGSLQQQLLDDPTLDSAPPNGMTSTRRAPRASTRSKPSSGARNCPSEAGWASWWSGRTENHRPGEDAARYSINFTVDTGA